MGESEETEMNIVAIIQARMASTRLPGKVMKPILGTPMLGIQVGRILRSRMIDGALVATTDNPKDECINQILGRYLTYRGSEEDVLDRVLKAAQECEADIIVELTGDCPLVDPAMIDKVVADYLLGGADFVYNRIPGVDAAPIGMDVRVFSTDALAEIDKKTNDPADREHVSLHFWEHPDEYECRCVPTVMPEWAYDLRLTVDTQADLDLVTIIFEELGVDCTLYDIIELFDKRPELLEINSHIRQKAVR